MKVSHYEKERFQEIEGVERFFVQSQKPSSAMMKLSLMRKPHRKGRPRVTSVAEDKFITVTSLRNYSPNKCFRGQVTDASQHQLFRGDCVNQAFVVKLLQRNHY